MSVAVLKNWLLNPFGRDGVNGDESLMAHISERRRMRILESDKMLRHAMRGPLSRGRGFAAGEDGAMYVLAMFLLVAMLIFSGLAIDFMRYELYRTRLQATLDRAILAAAHPDQPGDRKAVVLDYFKRAGLEHTIDEDSIIVEKDSYTNAVDATASLKLHTPFLSWSGVSSLVAPASGRAEKGVALTEISMVLDVSGSMAWGKVDYSDPAPGEKSRLASLKDAAVKFSNLLLCNPNDATKTTGCTVASPDSASGVKAPISISVIPYGAYVNAGDQLLQAFDPIGAHDRNSCATFSEGAYEVVGVAPTPPAAELALMTEKEKRDQLMHQSTAAMTRKLTYRYHELSSRAYKEDHYRTDLTPCHRASETWREITPFQHDAAKVKSYVNALKASGNTSIEMGLKWGTTLLHPDAQPVIEKLTIPTPVLDGDGNPVVDDGGQPVTTPAPIHKIYKGRPYDPNKTSSRKILVLMTDGVNTSAVEMRDGTRTGPSPIWLAKSETQSWSWGGWGTPSGWRDDDEDFDGAIDEGNVLSVYHAPSDQYLWHFVHETTSDGYGVSEKITKVAPHPFGTLPTDCLEEQYVRRVCAPTSEPRRLSYHQFWAEENYHVDFLEDQFPWILTDGVNRPLVDADRATHVVQAGTKDKPGTKNARLAAQCKAAKEAGIIIVSIDMKPGGNPDMKSCASKTALDGGTTPVLQYYKVSTTNIAATFSKLASDINKLRLTR